MRTSEPGRLVDTLLCCAVIEARSCERFGLLADGVGDASLADFYRSLLAAEARHHGIYVELARGVEASAGERLKDIMEHEARVLAEAPPWPRLHT